MAGWRRAVELAMTCEEIERLTALSRSRTEPASRVSRAQMLLAYRENPSFCAVGQRGGVHHQTVQRCVARALGYGPLAAIEDRPRPGRGPVFFPFGQNHDGRGAPRLVRGGRRIETHYARATSGGIFWMAVSTRELRATDLPGN